MAKYLKDNQIKAGTTIFVVHPKFKYIECKFITSKTFLSDLAGSKIKKFKFKSLKYFEINDGQVTILEPLFKTKSSGLIERFGYCGDNGIPDKNGVFSYKQERRAFPTLNKAVKYWMSCQTPENLKRWHQENLEDNSWNW
ncbi:hypothetical protein [Acinetobacter phage vB_AbaP_HB01]|nr:hypothetical protein [Acinetobacter phage vB_AbaP_HB01]